MPVKFIENGNRPSNISRTGVKLVKNVEPSNQMVLYKSPKGVFKKLKKLVTYEIDVWVAKFFWPKERSGVASTSAPNKDPSKWVYGVVKETHLNVWGSSNAADMYINVKCVDINGLNEYNTTIMEKNVYVISGPNWDLRGFNRNVTSNQNQMTISETTGSELLSIYEQFNNE